MQLLWSRRALSDVEHLRDYIAQDSAFYARQFTERLIKIYRLRDAQNQIEIVSVLHGSRDLGGMDEKPWGTVE